MKNSRLRAAVDGPIRTISTRQRKVEANEVVDAANIRETSTTSSSPKKRKVEETSSPDLNKNNDLNSSPTSGRILKKPNFFSSPTFKTSTSTTTPTNQIGLGFSFDGSSSDVEEDDYILRPGQNKGKRVSLGSPKGLEDPNLRLNARAKAQSINESDAAHRSFGSSPTLTSEIRSKEKLRLRREDEMDLGTGSEIEDEGQSQDSEMQDGSLIREDSEELVITPRDVRER